MGHGLQAKQSGRHFVFAAGTGILCFVDLVASMIHDKLKLFDNEKDGPSCPTSSRNSKLLKGQDIANTVTQTDLTVTDEDVETFIKPENNIFGADDF